MSYTRNLFVARNQNPLAQDLGLPRDRRRDENRERQDFLDKQGIAIPSGFEPLILIDDPETE